jgi:hypothetical protein
VLKTVLNIEAVDDRLSTPSLGITLVEGNGFSLRIDTIFQLPLSGSHGVLQEFRGRRHRELSTPSLGITEPDSGIFRLSAAFCRGAPSHK